MRAGGREVEEKCVCFDFKGVDVPGPRGIRRSQERVSAGRREPSEWNPVGVHSTQVPT